VLRLISCNLTSQCLAVTGGGSVGKCCGLSQPSWLFGSLNIVILTYLLTYLLTVSINKSLSISYVECHWSKSRHVVPFDSMVST